MGRSYKKKTGTILYEAPAQWTDLKTHKYCGRTDWGRGEKPNHVHKCRDCVAAKAWSSNMIRQNTDARRREKIAWESQAGEW